MKAVRPFIKDDIPQVVHMFRRLLLGDDQGRRLLSPAELPEYFEQIFFHNPWYDEEIPSLVYQSGEGKIIGFLGVAPRPMMLRSRPIRMAISFHLMVEPESRNSLAGVQLLKSFFSGPQDLSITDGAGEVGRKVWEGVGGTTAFLYSQRWIRILRPSQFVIDRLGRRMAYPRAVQALSPLCNLTDAAAAKFLPDFFPKLTSRCTEEDLDADTLLTHLPHFTMTRALQPVYDDLSLQWVLKHAEQMAFYGSLKKVLVRDQHGNVIGWYLYYLKAGKTSTVLQLAARQNTFNEILDHLFDHARRHGATSLIGRLEPQYIQELSDKYCCFNRFGSWTLIHSNNSELLHVIQRGDAFLTGLEGEWCLLF